jgi:hypothetical protein
VALIAELQYASQILSAGIVWHVVQILKARPVKLCVLEFVIAMRHNLEAWAQRILSHCSDFSLGLHWLDHCSANEALAYTDVMTASTSEGHVDSR